jgi:hypothetical protein
VVHRLGRFHDDDARTISMAADKHEILEFPNLIDQDLPAALLSLAIRACFVRINVGRGKDVAKVRVIIGQEPAAGRAVAAGRVSFDRRLAEQVGCSGPCEPSLADAFRASQ